MIAVKLARRSAGLSIEDAAKQAGCSAQYLRRVERLGGCSYPLARRLSRIYRCSLNAFLIKSGQADARRHQTEKKKPGSAGAGIGKKLIVPGGTTAAGTD